MQLKTMLALSAALACAGFAQEAAPMTAEQVIEKSIEATGGREKMAKLTSMTAKGTIEIAAVGARGTLEIFTKAPNKRLTVASVEGYGDVIQGFDGKVAWAVNPQGAVEITGQALEDTKRDSVFNGQLKWKELYEKAELKGKQKVGDRDAWVLVLTPAGGKPVTTYIDAENFLTLRTTAVRMTDQGEGEITSESSDWRTLEGGIKTAFKVKQNMPFGEMVIQLSEVKFNVEIDDAKFTKPAK